MSRISGNITQDNSLPRRDLSNGSHYSTSSNSQSQPDYLSSTKNLRLSDTNIRQPRISATRANVSFSINPALLSSSSNFGVLTSSIKNSNGAYLVPGYTPTTNQFAYSRTYEGNWNSQTQNVSHSTDSLKSQSSSSRVNYSPIIIHSGGSSAGKTNYQTPTNSYSPIVPSHSYTQSQRWSPATPIQTKPSTQVVSGINKQPQNPVSPAFTRQPMVHQQNHSLTNHQSDHPHPSPVMTTYSNSPMLSALNQPSQAPPQPTDSRGSSPGQSQTPTSPTHQPLSSAPDYEQLYRSLLVSHTQQQQHVDELVRTVDALRRDNDRLKQQLAQHTEISSVHTSVDGRLRNSDQSATDTANEQGKYAHLVAQVNLEKRRLDLLAEQIMSAAPVTDSRVKSSTTSGDTPVDVRVPFLSQAVSSTGSNTQQQQQPAQQSFDFKKKTSTSDVRLSADDRAAGSTGLDKIAWYRQLKKQRESVLEPAPLEEHVVEPSAKTTSAVKVASEEVVQPVQKQISPDPWSPSKPKKTTKQKKGSVKVKGETDEPPQQADFPEKMVAQSPRSSAHQSVAESQETTISKLVAHYRRLPADR